MAIIDNKKDQSKWVVTKESNAHWINGSTSELIHTKEISRDEAWRRYLIGDYTMRVPPVNTDQWDDWSWVKWIFPNIKADDETNN